MWKSSSIEVLISLPDSGEISAKIREHSSRFHFQHVDPKDFESITPERWAKTDVLITDLNIPSPETASNLKWVQFYNKFNLNQVKAYQQIYPNTIFTSAEGVNIQIKASDILHLLFSPHMNVKSVYGATIGIVGYGSLGREMARILQTFYCTILASTFNAMTPIALTYQPDNTGDETGDCFDRLYPIQALPSMLAQCDFVINTLTKSSKSVGFITANIFEKITPGTPFVSTANSEVIDLDSIQPLIEDNIILYLSSEDNQRNEKNNGRYAMQFFDLLQKNMKHFSDNQTLLNIIQ